ncbi:MAG: hypothetical protein ACRC9R_06715 [Enterovibrio sp.]
MKTYIKNETTKFNYSLSNRLRFNGVLINIKELLSKKIFYVTFIFNSIHLLAMLALTRLQIIKFFIIHNHQYMFIFLPPLKKSLFFALAFIFKIAANILRTTNIINGVNVFFNTVSFDAITLINSTQYISNIIIDSLFIAPSHVKKQLCNKGAHIKIGVYKCLMS